VSFAVMCDDNILRGVGVTYDRFIRMVEDLDLDIAAREAGGGVDPFVHAGFVDAEDRGGAGLIHYEVFRVVFAHHFDTVKIGGCRSRRGIF